MKNLLERLFAEERARLGWDDDEEEEANEDEEMNGEDGENGVHGSDDKMDEDKIKENETNGDGEGDEEREKMDEKNSPVKRRSGSRSPTRRPINKSREEEDDDDHSGPTTDFEEDSATKVQMRQLLRQKLQNRQKDGDSTGRVQLSNDSPIVSDIDTNDDVENKVSLRSILRQSLEEASSNDEHNATKNSSNNSGDEVSSTNASPKRNGKSSPKKKLSRSKQRDKIEEPDTVMLGASETPSDSKLLARDDSVVLLGSASGSPSVSRSPRVSLKKSNK